MNTSSIWRGRDGRFAVFAFLLALLATATVWPYLGEGKYTDLIVGNVAWTGQNKSRDIVAFYVLAMLFLLFCGSFLWFYHRKLRAKPGARLVATNLVGILLLPVAFGLGIALIDPSRIRRPYEWLAASAIVLVLIWLLARRSDLSSRQLWFVSVGSLSIVVASFFDGITFVHLLARLSSSVGFQVTEKSALVVISICLIMALGFVGICSASGSAAATIARVKRGLFCVQIPLPLLLLFVLPPRIYFKGVWQRYEWPRTLILLLVALIAIAWVVLARKIRQSWRTAESPSLEGILVPLCFVGVAVFLAVPTMDFPTLWGDYFHAGEMIVPWQQVAQFGKVPYIDFAPVHALMPLLNGFFNAFFYDGTLANFTNASTLAAMIAAAVTFLCISGLAGIPIALCCAIVFPLFDRTLFLGAALIVLAAPILLKNPRDWLLTWGAADIFMFLYNPSLGVAYCLATAPGAMVQMATLYRLSRPRFFRLTGLATVLALSVMLTPITRRILTGYVSFILDMGSTNSLANGIPWLSGWQQTSFPASVLSSAILFQSVRLGWIPFFVFAGYLTAREVMRRNFISAFFPLTVLLMLGFQAPWVLGRMEPGSLSRSGWIAFICAGQLLPIFAVNYTKRYLMVGLSISACLAGIYSAALGQTLRLGATDFVARAFKTVDLSTLKYIRGVDFGMPNLGNLYVDEAKFNELVSLKTKMEPLFRGSDRTFYDFANSQGLYYCLGKPAPTYFTSPYVAPNAAQQGRTISDLDRSRPSVVLVAPYEANDGGTVSLRSYRVYKWLMQHYQPYSAEGAVFLVNGDSAVFEAAMKARSSHLRALSSVLVNRDLRMLPRTWGRSWESLRSLFGVVEDIDTSSPVRTVGISIENGAMRCGERFDEQFYLATYPDVRAAVAAGTLFKSGWEHYRQIGKRELRLGAPPPFDEEFYLDSYPDVKAAVLNKSVASGYAHYQSIGRSENRLAAYVGYFVEYALRQPREGMTADYLLLHLKVSGPGTPEDVPVEIRWKSEIPEQGDSIRFVAAPGYMLIPMGSCPAWLLARQIQGIRIAFDLPFASSFMIKATLLSLR